MKNRKSTLCPHVILGFAFWASILMSGFNAYSQDSPERFLQWMKDDPVALVGDVGPRGLLTAATFAGALSIISLSDASTSQSLQHHYQKSDYLHFANQWGAWKMVTPISAGIFGASLVTHDIKFQDAAFTSLQSVIMTNIVTKSSKFIFGRERPGGDDGTHDFDFVQGGGTSFPSGHTATAFAVITPWVMYYPSPVTYTLMAIPVGTAVARVAKGRHWFSDVAAGAAIGFSMGYYLSKRHLSFYSDRIQVMPTAGRDHFSLTINFSF